MPRAIFLPRDFLRAALARARLSVAAKLWEPPAAETGLAVGAKPVPSKEERAREARGVRETSAWALRERAAWALRVLRPALVMGGGVGTAAFLRGAEGRRVGAPARGAGVERSGMLARSVCHRVRRAGACLLDKHGGTNAKSQDTRKRAAVGRLRQENRLLEGWWKGKEGVAEKGGALYNASY